MTDKERVGYLQVQLYEKRMEIKELKKRLKFFELLIISQWLAKDE